MSHIMYIDSLIIHRNRCVALKWHTEKKEGHSSESATLMSRRQTHKSFMPPNIKKCLPDIK